MWLIRAKKLWGERWWHKSKIHHRMIYNYFKRQDAEPPDEVIEAKPKGVITCYFKEECSPEYWDCMKCWHYTPNQIFSLPTLTVEVVPNNQQKQSKK